MDISDREVITLQVGQAGLQMGQAIWELLSVEHDIQVDGRKKECSFDDNERISTFFRPTNSGQYVPRALFLDLEPSVIDEIRIGRYREMFHPDCFISAFDDSASNFARAYYTTGSFVVSSYMDRVRNLVEQCDNVQAFIIIHSTAGGTGSGLCSRVAEHLSTIMGKTCKIELPISPSPVFSNSIVEPYNCVLSSHFCMEHNDISILADNEAMYEICMRYMNLDSPTFHNLNRILAHMVSTITSSIRFEGSLRADISQLGTNLVPYPRIHFLVPSFAPVLSLDRSLHESLSVTQITNLAFDPNCRMVKLETDIGKFMSIALLYRGDVTPRAVGEAILTTKRQGIQFVDWCPTGFKVSLNSQPACIIPGSRIAPSTRFVSMLANNTAAAQSFVRIISKFHSLYQKRAFVHWYVGEGLEEGEFSEGVENIRTLALDYDQCAMDSVDDDRLDLGTPSIEEGGANQKNASLSTPSKRGSQPGSVLDMGNAADEDVGVDADLGVDLDVNVEFEPPIEEVEE